MKKNIIGKVVRSADLFDEIAKWKCRCYAFIPTSFIVGLIIGILVTDAVLH